jgi:hypothetical protein
VSERRALPWTKKGDGTVLAGKFGKSLVLQTFVDPQGRDHDFSLIVAKSWSVILAVTMDGLVPLVKQYKQGCDQVIEELPAGTAGKNPSDTTPEPPELVARRELLAETGYEAGKIVSLGFAWMNSRNSATGASCFLATGCRKIADGKVERDEAIETYTVSLTEWLRKVLSGGVEEYSAVVATTRAIPRLIADGQLTEEQLLQAVR